VASDHVAQSIEGESRVAVVADHAAGSVGTVALVAGSVDVTDGVHNTNLDLLVESSANKPPTAVVNEFGFPEMRIHK
jgi:hypothetical protein